MLKTPYELRKKAREVLNNTENAKEIFENIFDYAYEHETPLDLINSKLNTTGSYLIDSIFKNKKAPHGLTIINYNKSDTQIKNSLLFHTIDEMLKQEKKIIFFDLDSNLYNSKRLDLELTEKDFDFYVDSFSPSNILNSIETLLQVSKPDYIIIDSQRKSNEQFIEDSNYMNRLIEVCDNRNINLICYSTEDMSQLSYNCKFKLDFTYKEDKSYIDLLMPLNKYRNKQIDRIRIPIRDGKVNEMEDIINLAIINNVLIMQGSLIKDNFTEKSIGRGISKAVKYYEENIELYEDLKERLNKILINGN